jgi:isoleucyl-tRNA synthetase
MHHALEVLTRIVAPFAVHLAEELHGFRRGVDPSKETAPSVVLEGWPVVPSTWSDPALAHQWEDLRSLRRLVFRAIEEAKLADVVKSASEAEVRLIIPSTIADALTTACVSPDGAPSLMYSLDDIFLCAAVRVDTNSAETPADDGSHLFSESRFRGHGPVQVRVTKTAQSKCPRCWRHICEPETTLCPSEERMSLGTTTTPTLAQRQ